MLELRSQAAGDISALRIAQERLRAVEGSLADAQRRGHSQAATIETQGLQMEQLRVALQVCVPPQDLPVCLMCCLQVARDCRGSSCADG